MHVRVGLTVVLRGYTHCQFPSHFLETVTILPATNHVSNIIFKFYVGQCKFNLVHAAAIFGLCYVLALYVRLLTYSVMMIEHNDFSYSI